MVDTVYMFGTGPHIAAQPLVGSITASTGLDTSWVTSGVYCNSVEQDSIPFPGGTPTEGWYHEIYGRTGNVGASRNSLTLRTSAGLAFLRLVVNSTAHTIQCYYSLNGTVFTAFGTAFAVSGNPCQLDANFKVNSVTGFIDVYQDKILVASTGVMDLSAVANCGKVTWGGYYATGSGVHSEIVVANFSTLFYRVKQMLFTSVGALADFVGAVATINESVPDTSTFSYSNTVNAQNTWKGAARTFTGYLIKMVGVQWSSLKSSGSGPQNVRPVFRIGGANYYGASQALTYGISSYNVQFATDPATSAAWTATQAGDANLEIGIQALT